MVMDKVYVLTTEKYGVESIHKTFEGAKKYRDYLIRYYGNYYTLETLFIDSREVKE